jgi:hypothetical protein
MVTNGGMEQNMGEMANDFVLPVKYTSYGRRCHEGIKHTFMNIEI